MKILIIDDHPMVRKGIKSMLELEEVSYMIYEAGNSKETFDVLRKEKIELVIVDLNLGSENGLDIIYKSKEIRKEAKFLILTSFMSEADFLRGEDMGLDGYILKDAFVEDITYAINSITRGKKYYDPSIVSYKNKSANNALTEDLTLREREVLIELCKGLSNQEISRNLFISESTVKKHVSSILGKLNLAHRSQVIYYMTSLKYGELKYHE